jgi:hypothetical protein
MITTKKEQIDYKKIIVVRISRRNDFVVLLYRVCSSVKKKIISELQRIYYKTTKISYFSSAFFPLQQYQKHN